MDSPDSLQLSEVAEELYVNIYICIYYGVCLELVVNASGACLDDTQTAALGALRDLISTI